MSINWHTKLVTSFTMAVCFASPSIAAEDALEEFRLLYTGGTEADRRSTVPTDQDRKSLKVLEPLVTGQYSGNAEAQFYYGILLNKFGKRDEAIIHLQKILLLDPPTSYWYQAAEKSLQRLEAPQPIATSASKGGRVGYVGFGITDHKITKVLANSPAAQAHLEYGDVIVSVDGLSASNLSTDELTKRIRGPIGSRVKLVVSRQGKEYTVGLIRSEASWAR